MPTTLYQLGSVTFQQTPLETHDVTHELVSDYAPKDVIQSPRPREFVGEGDEHITLIGTLFPTRIGGLDELATLQRQRHDGLPWPLVRGDGVLMGSFYIEHISEHDTFLTLDGVGRLKEVSINLVRAPDLYLSADAKKAMQTTAENLLRSLASGFSGGAARQVPLAS